MTAIFFETKFNIQLFKIPFLLWILGGNQRELARAKNAKKQEKAKKAEGSGKDFAKRKES